MMTFLQKSWRAPLCVGAIWCTTFSYMTEGDYQRLRRILDERLAEAEQRARAEHEEAILALDRLRAIARSATSLSPVGRHGDLVQAVRTATMTVTAPFTIASIESFIRAERPELLGPSTRKSISSALRRLQASGGIIRIAEGKGTTPATYARVEQGKELPMGFVSGRQA